MYTAAPAAAAGQSNSCPSPGGTPGIGHSPRFTDNNVALFAGGDYTADGATAEAEGLLVVKGDATFAKSGGGVFNVGRAGAGSGILPTPGAVMLAVGGDMSIAKGTTVDVGHGLTTGPGYGGSVHVGGTLDDKGVLETSGGTRVDRMGPKAALSPYASFDGTIAEESSSLGSLKPTGTSERNGKSVTFRSTGPSTGNLQVFEISAADLDGTSSFTFESIPDGSSVVVNVTGSGAVGISPMSVGFNGDRVDLYSSPDFGEAASRILYNFRETTSLTLGGGGNFMGSVLAPKASADITASTNGRLYIGGDVRTHGTGNESHNYPWTGSPAFSCKPEKPSPSAPSTPPAQPDEPGEPSPPEKPTRPAEEPGAPDRPEEPSAPARPDGSPQPAEPSPAPSASSPATPEDDGFLATTGAGPTVTLSVAAAAVLAVGAAFYTISRRRRRR